MSSKSGEGLERLGAGSDMFARGRVGVGVGVGVGDGWEWMVAKQRGRSAGVGWEEGERMSTGLACITVT